MRAILSTVLMCGCLLSCFSQTSFQKKLDIFLKTPQLCAVADGSACYVADAFATNGINHLHIYKLDGQGNVQWHSEQTGTDINLRLHAIQSVTDGVVLLFNSYHSEQESNSYLIKFNLNGSLAWERRMGVGNFTQLFDIQPDPEGNLWTSGLHLKTGTGDSSYHFLAKMDKNAFPLAGKQAYFRYFPNTGYEACRFTDLTWNRFNNTLLFVEDFANPYAQIAIPFPNRKRSSLGSCDPLFNLDERITGHHFTTLENADSMLIFSGRTSQIDFLPGGPGIGILDKTGKNPLVVKSTPSIFQPIHSYSGDIVFYVPETQLIIKFDRSLSPVRTIKLDNCPATAFDADIASDGTMYVVRNIDNKTVVARVLSDGSLPACTTYHRTPPEMADDLVLESLGYNPNGYPAVPFTETSWTLGFTEAAFAGTDFCVRMDAAFAVPDTICLGAEVLPEGVDTTEGLGHTWDMDEFRSENRIPHFPFPGTGLFTVFHRVANDICMDTASRFVQVVPRPDIPFEDTLVCGPASVTLDFSGQGATGYYLNGMPAEPVIRIDQSGIFNIRLQNGGCFVEKNVHVKIVSFAPPILPQDTAYCHGDTVKVALGMGFGQVLWDHVATPDSFVILDGVAHTYQARYEPDTTCLVSGTYSVVRTICRSEEEVMYVPNVFSPGSGGANAVFQVFPMRFVRIRSMQVFNRWGSLVYDYRGETPEWDGAVRGQAGPPDVYTYWIEYLDERDASVQVRTGDVLLLR